MNFKEIKELISIFASESDIDELEVERSGTWVRFKRAGSSKAPLTEQTGRDPVNVPAEVPPDSAASDAPLLEDQSLVSVISPIVGTFYRSPNPEVDPFVGVGDIVEKGATVCIIEAMKLMNEIEAEASGEIVSIFVENGHPVEYGERLFAIRPC